MKFRIGMLKEIVLFGFLIRNCSCIRWIGLGKLNRTYEQELEGFTQSECDAARNTKMLRPRHYKFCLHNRHRFAMHAVLVASKAASYFCMKTFRDRRWNCNSIEALPKMSPELKIGSQEQAIVHAFSSAALLFEISRRCSQSKLRHCPCGRSSLDKNVSSESIGSQYYYANCPDNVEMGVEYAKKFLGYERMGEKRKENSKKSNDKPKSKNQKKGLIKKVNGHNYAAGLEIMRRSWTSKCRCHGVSGSCANEICFRQLRRIDDDVLLKILKDHYLSAKYVTSIKDGKLYTDQNSFLEPTDLAFTEHSPDYCDPDLSVGSVGTKNRQCETTNVNHGDTNYCGNMCCGRGHRNVIEQETIKCNCSLDQFYHVKCKECTQIHDNKFCL